MFALHTTLSLSLAAGGLALHESSTGVAMQQPDAETPANARLWRTVDESILDEDATLNLCMRKRLAPQFFLLGVPKAGAARFFEGFTSSPGVVNYRPGDEEPEWHTKEPWVFADGFDVNAMDQWLGHYPECDQSKRLVAIDCTPGYFGNRKAPYAIANVYGGTHQVKSRLLFMVLLRDPVARIHSHYYHYISNGVMKDALPACPAKTFPPTFYITVKSMIDKGYVCNCPCDNLVTDSKYVESFRRYLTNFAASQFHVIPFGSVVDKKIIEYAWDMLGVPHGLHRGSFAEGFTFVQNDIGPHPNIVTELDEPTLLELEAYMDRVAGPQELAALFAGSDINMFNFTASSDDGASIERWLRSSWGRA